MGKLWNTVNTLQKLVDVQRIPYTIHQSRGLFPRAGSPPLPAHSLVGGAIRLSFGDMQWVLSKSQAKGLEKFVLFLLAYRMNPDNEDKCWPSVKGIAKNCGISEREVVRCIQNLTESGELICERRTDDDGHRLTNCYSLSKVPVGHLGEALSANQSCDQPSRDQQSPKVVSSSNLKEDITVSEAGPCLKCGNPNQEHKCPGHLTQKQKDKRWGPHPRFPSAGQRPQYPRNTERAPRAPVVSFEEMRRKEDADYEARLRRIIFSPTGRS